MPSNSQPSVDVYEDSYYDTPPLFDEEEHELYDSRDLLRCDSWFVGGFSQVESGCNLLSFESPLLLDEEMKVCEQEENFKNEGCKDKGKQTIWH